MATTFPNLVRFLHAQHGYMVDSPDAAFVADVAIPHGLGAAKLYFRRRRQEGGLSFWLDPIRATGFAPTVLQSVRLGKTIGQARALGMELANIQITWSERAGWAPTLKAYIQSEHLGPLHNSPYHALWRALGSTEAQAAALAARCAGRALEGIACALQPNGMPSGFEIYDLPTHAHGDCMSREYGDPLGETCVVSAYAFLGNACGPELLAPYLGPDHDAIGRILDALPNPRPGAVGVAKTNAQGETAKAVSLETVRYRDGVPF